MKRGEWLTERPNLASNAKTLTVCSNPPYIIDQARMMPSQKCKREEKSQNITGWKLRSADCQETWLKLSLYSAIDQRGERTTR